MRKVAVIGDLHSGEGDGNLVLMDYQLTYLENEFIPYLIANNIKIVYQLGDIFDVRKSTNTNVLYEWKTRFFDKLLELGIQLETLVGNHDSYFANTLKVNTQNVHLDGYTNILIHDEVYENEETSQLWCPWICKSNQESIFDAIKNSSSELCLGHFEIKGARMESSICTDGLPISLFKKFKLVLSGHFHSKGDYDNVTYVGTPYQMSWGDYGHDKGFHILDLDTLELEFIKNESDLFFKITYDEDASMNLYLEQSYKNSHVKVVIENRDNFPKYEKWFSIMESKGMASLKVIEPLMERNSGDTDIEVDGELTRQSTEDLILDYVNDLYPEKKDKLSRMMLSLHSESRK